MRTKQVFSSFSVDDIPRAKQFYGEILGLDVKEEREMGLALQFDSGGSHFIYPKEDHRPASFTVLNFLVDDLGKAMEELKGKGIKFERYDGFTVPQDDQGVLRGSQVGMGPDIAWFKDPAGNVLSVLQERTIEEGR